MEKLDLRLSPLSVQNVTKTYSLSHGKTIVALNNVSLDIRAGEIFGLLGPNGAGKTTLINCAIGLIPFDSGHIHVFGADVIQEYVQARSKVGFVYQEIALDNFLKAQKMLQLHRGLYNRSHEPQRVEKILKELDLWQYRDKFPDQMSGGMKRRLAIAKALVHEPPFVILDEPTAGVDLEAREKMWDVIRKINKNGITILLTTHYIEEAEAICDRIGIINFGKFVRVAPTRQLVTEMGQRVMIVHVSKKVDPNILGQAPFKSKIHECPEKDRVRYEILVDQGFKEIHRCLAWFQSHRVEVLDIDLKQTTLQEVFRSIAWGNPA